MKIYILSFLVFGVFQAGAQLPNRSDKLIKEQGFGVLKIRALLSEVKGVLLKDTIDKKTSFEPKAQAISHTDRIYLVDLKKPGYAQFCGKNIVRIEVLFEQNYDGAGDKANDFIITEVKIFFKAVSAKDTEAFAKKLMNIYGQPATFGSDDEMGTNGTWSSPLVLMNFTSYRGDPFTEEMKSDYIKVRFNSAVGG